MPHATNRYPFEWKVFNFAGDLHERIFGRKGGAFVLSLSADGSVASLNFVPPDGGWDKYLKALDAAEIPYLFFDPFDAPEYTWMSWERIGQPEMERMMGEPFKREDFVRLSVPKSKSRELPRAEFPSSWGVMF